ncbi:MAG: hypothetical protein PUG33_02850 [Mollicutes bacterium]|nr:hypothetical protein [Mollicutes bacterium]MDY5875358.1 hypothetical protein [Bacilli bacterium]
MEINLEKLEEIYGKSLVKEMHDDIENLIENMKYLDKLEFDDIYDIIEVNPYLFLIDNNEFIKRINNLITSLGIEYLQILAEDTSYWGNIEC